MSCGVWGAVYVFGTLLMYVMGLITIPFVVKLKTSLTEIRAGVKISNILKRKNGGASP